MTNFHPLKMYFYIYSDYRSVIVFFKCETKKAVIEEIWLMGKYFFTTV